MLAHGCTPQVRDSRHVLPIGTLAHAPSGQDDSAYSYIRPTELQHDNCTTSCRKKSCMFGIVEPIKVAWLIPSKSCVFANSNTKRWVNFVRWHSGRPTKVSCPHPRRLLRSLPSRFRSPFCPHTHILSNNARCMICVMESYEGLDLYRCI